MNKQLLIEQFGEIEAEAQVAYYNEKPSNASLQYKAGAVAGKFRLLHKGHKELIERAIGLCEKLYVFIADDPSYHRYSTINELQQAFGKLFLKYEYTNFEIIIVPPLPAGIEWDSMLLEKAPDLQVIFNSKEDYDNYLIPNQFLQLFVDESVSVTTIEAAPTSLQNSNLVITEFKPYMNKKVVVTGIESCGKTMLAKKLADIYETNFSEEYGRYHSQLYMGLQEASYEPKDFVHIVLKQIIQDKEQNLEASRLLVVDTDPIVTLYYLELYKKDVMATVDEDAYNQAVESIERMIIEYKADMWVYLEPKTPYVADGLRWNDDEQVRIDLNIQLKAMYQKYGFADKLVYIDAIGYDERFAESIRAIEDKLSIQVY